jgi:UDP-glucose:(heptosyl)LPS alpha-1,3-glucosyltransferase
MFTPHFPAPRVAIVIDRFDGRRGGAARWTRDFVAWLLANQCDVHVLARTIGPAEVQLPLTFHLIDAARSPLAFATAVASRLSAVAPLISHDMGAAIGCDLFQPHVGSPAACWNGSVASYPPWLRPWKRLCGLSPRYCLQRRMSAAQYGSRNSLFIAVSHKSARDMHELHGVPRRKIRVVHNGVDCSRFAPAVFQDDSRILIRRDFGVSDSEVLLISMAHHARLKGVPGLIRAVHQLRREGYPVKLLLCGGPAGRSQRVVRHGAILHAGCVADAASFYAAADVSVHPTFYDACSLVTLEAMAAGLPVVTTRGNGASEFITHGVDGLLLDSPHNDDALVAALRLLLRSDSLRRQLGSAARRLIGAHTVERNYHEIVATYAEVLDRRNADASSLEPLLSSESTSSAQRAAACISVPSR